jgi:hypothetical protein
MKAKIPKGIAILFGILVLIFGYLSYTRTESGRNCRICAATFDHWTCSIFGIRIWSWDTKPVPSERTEEFNTYLGYEHEHEWTGGGYSVYSNFMVGCGSCSFGSYPRHQFELTRMGLRLIAASGIREKKQRRDFYEQIIKSEDFEHYARVSQTYRVISDQIPDYLHWKYKYWSPEMDGIEIPQYLKNGKLISNQTSQPTR